MGVPFVDLAAQRRALGDRIDRAMAQVVEHGQFVMGPEVRQLEEELARFCGARHAVSCSSGTDALVLALRALGVTAGDAVVVPTFTFAATAEAVAFLGATPVFADSRVDTGNMDPGSVASALDGSSSDGRTPVGVIAVDLYGQPAEYGPLAKLADEAGVWLLADAAQSLGGAQDGRRVGTLAAVTATSFFPAKPLGCYGDGGAVFTDDDNLAGLVRSLRVHGQGRSRYDYVHIGMNARLDTLQAAVLLAKLTIFEDELAARQEVADRYSRMLPAGLALPAVLPGTTSAWAQYTIRTGRRDDLAAALAAAGIPSAVYYPVPLHKQGPYTDFSHAPSGLAGAEELAAEVLSLPMHPYLDAPIQDRICDVVAAALSQG